jgi:hypothetical protein
MFKYILEGAGNINWMAISALITFFAVFVIGAILAFRTDPSMIKKMANLPFDDNAFPNAEIDNRHEK